MGKMRFTMSSVRLTTALKTISTVLDSNVGTTLCGDVLKVNWQFRWFCKIHHTFHLPLISTTRVIAVFRAPPWWGTVNDNNISIREKVFDLIDHLLINRSIQRGDQAANYVKWYLWSSIWDPSLFAKKTKTHQSVKCSNRRCVQTMLWVFVRKWISKYSANSEMHSQAPNPLRPPHRLSENHQLPFSPRLIHSIAGRKAQSAKWYAINPEWYPQLWFSSTEEKKTLNDDETRQSHWSSELWLLPLSLSPSRFFFCGKLKNEECHTRLCALHSVQPGKRHKKDEW